MITVPVDNKDILQSLSEALDAANEDARSYLIGYAEGLIAGRQAQAPGGAG